MTFHYRYRKQIIIISTILLLIIAIISGSVYYYQKTSPKKTINTIKKESKDQLSKISKNKEENHEEKLEEYMVDIKGEIITPGIYKMSKNARVIDVIEKAGGLTDKADTTVINLSKKIKDEMVIIIYSKIQISNWLKTKEEENYLQEKCKNQETDYLENDACIIDDKIESPKPTGEKININKATKEELMTLTGIKDAKADAIISYRNKTPFKSIEDLKQVPGIGDSTYEQIKDNITI